jgi:hypothetical protein
MMFWVLSCLSKWWRLARRSSLAIGTGERPRRLPRPPPARPPLPPRRAPALRLRPVVGPFGLPSTQTVAPHPEQAKLAAAKSALSLNFFPHCGQTQILASAMETLLKKGPS